MARLGPLLLLFGLLARCGGGAALSTPGPPVPAHADVARFFVIRPGEQQNYRSGLLRPGDVVTCRVPSGNLEVRIPKRPPGALSVGKGIATPAGKKLTLQIRSTPSGSVVASCGHGNS